MFVMLLSRFVQEIPGQVYQFTQKPKCECYYFDWMHINFMPPNRLEWSDEKRRAKNNLRQYNLRGTRDCESPFLDFFFNRLVVIGYSYD